MTNAEGMTNDESQGYPNYVIGVLSLFRDSSFEFRHQKITPPFRRSLPSECAPRVLPGERTLFHRRSCPSWLQRRPHLPPFPPYRLPSPPPLSLSAENPPCTRCPGKFQYVL